MSQKVLYLEKKQGDWGVHDRAIPSPKAGELLVRVEATALNPVDWKIQKYGAFITEFPAIVGSDAAGIVEEVGAGVNGFAKGDRVLFPGSLSDSDRATFQQFAIADPSFTAKVPENVSLAAAASVPLGLDTAATGLYTKFVDRGGAEIQAPWSAGGKGKYAGRPFVVFGGSSSVGLYAIQLAKLSGFSPIIATASAHNEALLKSVGATHFVDRKADVPAAVRSITSEPVDYVYDAVSFKDTQEAAWSILSPEGTLITVTDPKVKPAEGEKKRIAHTLAILSLPNQRVVGEPLYQNLTQYLADGLIVPNEIEVLPGGLAGIPAGLKLLEADKVSGKKLVAKPHETA